MQNITISISCILTLMLNLYNGYDTLEFYLFFRPKSGSMLLYSRKKVRYRRDGYCWKKRKDGKTTREDHMKLKVQGTEVGKIQFFFFVNCFDYFE